MSEAPGQSAATALMQLADTSGSARYLEDIYGRGIIYRAFQTPEEAHAFVREPQIDDAVTYHPGDRAELFGDMALGALAAHRPDDVIVVCDVVSLQQRSTVSKCGSASTIGIELVPIQVGVEDIPTALDELQCQLATEAVRWADRNRASDAERCVYFIDWRSDSEDSVEPEHISAPDFEQHLKDVHGIGDVPRALLMLESLFRTHDPATHTVVWVRASKQATDTAWLVVRGADSSSEDADKEEASKDGGKDGSKGGKEDGDKDSE